MTASAKFLLVNDNGSFEPLADANKLKASLALIAGQLTFRTDDFGRKVHNLHAKSIEGVGRYFDSVEAELTDRRGDSFTGSMGIFKPRDLTAKMRRVMEERLPPLTADEAFPINTEIQPGFKFYEQFRTYSTGEAVAYRGGSGVDIPAVGIGAASVTQPIVYMASKIELDWMTMTSAQQVGLDVQARKMRAGRRVIAELRNRWIWEGNQSLNLYGVLNHPYMDTAVSTVAYTSASAADDIVEDLGYWANYAENESGSTFRPNTLAIAPKLANDLRNRRYGDNADKSILDWFLSANPHIERVILCRELNDALSSGVHGMLFYRRGAGNADSSLEIVDAMGATLLPPDQRALITEMYMLAGTGGLNQTEAGDNLLVYVEGVA